MAKITELPSLSAKNVNPASNLLPVVAGNQTDRATLNDLLEGYFNRGALTSGSAAALKNCLPRFKYLGTSVTSEQWAAIQNGITALRTKKQFCHFPFFRTEASPQKFCQHLDSE